jgi:hypothetical protein
MNPREKFLRRWKKVRAGAPADEDLIVQPYPGLRSFRPSEADLFFGRDDQIKDLQTRLSTRNVTVVLGSSGSGKSSLVRAGLIPRLQAQPIESRPGPWYAIEFRPGEAPSSEFFGALFHQIIRPMLELDVDHDGEETQLRLDAVHEVIARGRFGDEDSVETIQRTCEKKLRQELFRANVVDIDRIFEFVRRDLDQLDRALSRGAQAAAPNLLILIDQFEEVFGEKVDKDDRQMILSLVTSTYKLRPPGVYLIVTLRSEELHRCSEYRGLAEVVNGSLYLIDLIGEQDLAKAIEGPARLVLKSWGLPAAQPYTADAIALLKKTYRDGDPQGLVSDQLPLMQHLLPIIWDRGVERWRENGGVERLQIDANDIQAIAGWTDREGTLRGCLNAQADKVLELAVDYAVAAANRVAVAFPARLHLDSWLSRLGGGAFRHDEAQSSAQERALSADEVVSLIRVAFSMLAGREGLTNPKRDFSSLADILRMSGVAQRRRSMTGTDDTPCRVALSAGLDKFRQANFIDTIQEDGKEKYNVNHEAFIRAWRTYGKWLQEARRCEERLAAVDKSVQYQQIEPNAGIRQKIEELMFAKSLERASNVVTDDTARLLKDDVFGVDAIFSRTWAKEVLAKQDAIDERVGRTL